MPIDVSYKKIVLNHLQMIDGNAIDLLIVEGKNIESINRDLSLNDKNFLDLHFDNAIIIPGLINSHDHLDFDLFPRLGNKVYEDYLEWGNDIHKANKKFIKNVLKVPRDLRVQYGIYKNLLAGVTTVVHHGDYVNADYNLIDVYQRCNMLHSVQLQKQFKLKLNNPFSKSWPFVIHIGEGTNQKSHDEIDELIKWNILKRKIIGIHGIAMTEDQSKFFEALVWCPDSNFFLQHQTAAIDQLKKHTAILFGTDSTLSADWNIWNQLRLAQQTGLLTDEELYKAITISAAEIWNLNSGSLQENKDADIVVVKNNDTNSFFAFNPENILIVISKGKIILFDEVMLLQLKQEEFVKNFSKIYINNSCKYVEGNLPAVISKIKHYNPQSIFPVDIE